MNQDMRSFSQYPITHLTKSEVLQNHLISNRDSNSFLVADFASGEIDLVPRFFIDILPKFQDTIPERIVVYCTDIHALRLDGLLGILEESSRLDDVRVVQAKLEDMLSEARFRPDMLEYLNKHEKVMTPLDFHLKSFETIPPCSFDIGILNHDVVGYLFEYYKEYTDAEIALKEIHCVLKEESILIVTMPCILYPLDNIRVLESNGFHFEEGVDVDLSDGSFQQVGRITDLKQMSRLGHYTFLVFSRRSII